MKRLFLSTVLAAVAACRSAAAADPKSPVPIENVVWVRSTGLAGLTVGPAAMIGARSERLGMPAKTVDPIARQVR